MPDQWAFPVDLPLPLLGINPGASGGGELVDTASAGGGGAGGAGGASGGGGADARAADFTDEFEVKVLRPMRHENEGAVQAQRAFEHGRAVQRKAMVKEQQRLAAERKAKEREAALTRLKAEREAKQSLLGKDASDQVRDFERMQEEERRLIASLQATQAQQQAAYSELEGVLGSAQASRVR